MKISDISPKSPSIVYSVNELINFCQYNSIQLYFFNPNNNKFYIKLDEDFVKVELDLFTYLDNEKNLKLYLILILLPRNSKLIKKFL